jgi:hypothetical protein
VNNKAVKTDIPIANAKKYSAWTTSSVGYDRKKFVNSVFDFMVCDLLFGMAVPKKRVIRAIICNIAISVFIEVILLHDQTNLIAN